MEKFLNTYTELNANNLQLLADIYAEDIRFIDPAHEIKSLPRLTDYFASLYSNISSIQFQFNHHLRVADQGYVQWQMNFSHPRLKGGRAIIVDGASYLRFNEDGKVNFHRDYFDLGAMLYEQLPLLGQIIIAVKRRLGR
ncbi:nuclear transport factor 2 family protein [Desulfocastanea catecholica]